MDDSLLGGVCLSTFSTYLSIYLYLYISINQSISIYLSIYLSRYIRIARWRRGSRPAE
jgi:hypothetical protein